MLSDDDMDFMPSENIFPSTLATSLSTVTSTPASTDCAVTLSSTAQLLPTLPSVTTIPSSTPSSSAGVPFCSSAPTTFRVYDSLFVEDTDFIQCVISDDDDDVEDANVLQDDTLLSDILVELSGKIDYKLPRNLFNIWRGNVWEGAKIGFNRKRFNPCAQLDVVFADSTLNVEFSAEGAVDLGGPTREFLTLCMKSMQEGRCFIGDEKLLTRDAEAIAAQDYLLCGRIIATSLVHGGPGPHFIAPILFEAIVNGPEKVHVPLEALPPSEVKESLLQLKNLTVVQFIEALDMPTHSALATTIDNAGSMVNVKSVEDIETVVQRTAQYFLFGRTADCLDQFKSGLSTLGVLEAMRQHPTAFKQAFLREEATIDLRLMNKLFKTKISEDDDKKSTEMRVLNQWRQFLQQIDDDECTTSFQDILMFATGLRTLPPMGFQPGKPEIHFLHGDASKWPKANTCSSVLLLPVVHSSFAPFKEAMSFGIGNAQGFGFA
ncbi:G2/M phase-specific E3 ubiquitin-protein ligase-like [Antedon mediterranea]|uniref:G2/M phase-specific E3 ubiquitin-protein ligase-like n=1 Tax=Antedon mediterranea TaxID=105859 RepID=UPI003AF8FF46